MAEAADMSFSTLTPGFLDDPYDAYDRLRAADPVYWSAPENGWVLSRYADVARVLADPSFKVFDLAANVSGLTRAAGRDTAALNLVLGRVLALQNPPGHTRDRTFLAAALNARPAAAHAADIEAVVQDLVAAAPRGRDFNAISEVADLVSPGFLARFLGLSEDAMQALLTGIANVSNCFDRGRSIRFYERVNGEVAGALDLVLGHIAARGGKAEDGLGRIAELGRSRFGLDPREIAARILFLLLASVETTSSLAANAIGAIFSRPDILRALRGSPEKVPAAVEEVARLDPAFQQTTRIATREAKIGDKQIAPGDRLVLLIGAAHRDPAAYEAPSRFDLDREGPPHLGFGGGLHACLGSSLGRMMARSTIAGLIAADAEPAQVQSPRWLTHRFFRHLIRFDVTLPARNLGA